MLLTSALEQYREQARISAAAFAEAERQSSRGPNATVAVVTRYQLLAASLTFSSSPDLLSEQGIDAPPAGRASLTSIITEQVAVASMATKAAQRGTVGRLAATLVQDAGRTAATVDIVRRPAVTGYVRSLQLPSCSRCSVLAGRVYRYSTGFRRHPRCDCLMTPTTMQAGEELVTDPMQAVRDGKVTGLSKGDLEALDNGADLGQVVNVRRVQAGLTQGSSVIERRGRLTPQGIQRIASDREEAIRLLRSNGYLY